MRGGEISGGGAANQKLIVLCAVGKGIDAERVAAGGNVGDLKKTREAQVGRQHLFADCVKHFSLDALLLGRLDGSRKALERQSEGRILRLLIGKLLHLGQRFHEQELRLRAVIVNANGHVCGHLLKGIGDQVKAGDPIVIILDGGKGELGGQVGISDLNPGALGDGHLPLFEVGSLLVLSELTQKQIAAGLFLIRQAVRHRWSQGASRTPARAPASG